MKKPQRRRRRHWFGNKKYKKKWSGKSIFFLKTLPCGNMIEKIKLLENF